jgi:hypothetical protein
MRVVLSSVLVFAFASTAAAQSVRSIYSTGHMAIAQQRVYAVEFAGALASHASGNSGDWTEYVNPVGVSAFSPLTGVVSSTPPPTVVGERLFLVSQPSPDASLWERTTSGCWTPLGAPPAPASLANTPSIAASSSTRRVLVRTRPCGPFGTRFCPEFDERDVITVAVRVTEVAGDHVWFAQYEPSNTCGSAPAVTWTDASALDPTGNSFAADGSDVAVVSVPAALVGGGAALAGSHLFVITARGTVRHFDVRSGRWSDVGSTGAPVGASTRPPFRGSPWQVSGGAIQAILYPLPTPELRVLVGAHSTERNLLDSIFIARTTNGATWGWTQMLMGATSTGTATPYPASIATSFRTNTALSEDLEQVIYATEQNGDTMFFCSVPTLGLIIDRPFNDSVCFEFNRYRMLHPPDMGPVAGIPPSPPRVVGAGRDLLGSSVVGEVVPDPGWLVDHHCASPTSPCAQDAPSALRAFVTGDIAKAGYVYEMEAVNAPGHSDAPAVSIWHNLLAPHDPTTTLPLVSTNTCGFAGSGEFSADEYFGVVALMDTCGTLWRSFDDGMSWDTGIAALPSGATLRFPTIGGPSCTPTPRCCLAGSPGCAPADACECAASLSDANIGYDSMGNLYLTTLSDAALPFRSSNSIVIRRVSGFTPIGAPSTALVVPTSVHVVPDQLALDRPWLVVRRDVPDFVLLAWSNDGTFGTDGGSFTYCSGGDSGGNCASPTARWCPGPAPSSPPLSPRRAFELPGDCGGGGCPMTQAGDGSIWMALSPDRGCCITGTACLVDDDCHGGTCANGLCGCPTTTNVGFRQIRNLGSLGATCQAPDWSPPECMYYTAGPPTPTSPMSPSQLVQISGNTVAGEARWPNVLAGARDSGDILFTVPGGSDLSGGRCLTSTGPCRIDTLMLRRDAATRRWCGSSGTCLAAPFVADRRFVANGDDPSLQEDHTIPVPGFFDYGQASAYWMDFRSSPGTDVNYEYRRRLLRYSGDSILFSEESAQGWPQSLGVPVPIVIGFQAYGDVDFMATPHLHAHSIHLFAPRSPGTVVTITSSPRTPPQ